MYVGDVSGVQVRCAALHALGNSAFDATNRRRYLQSPGLMQMLVTLAAAPDSTDQNKDSSKGSCTRDAGSKERSTNSPRDAQPPSAPPSSGPADGIGYTASSSPDLVDCGTQVASQSGNPTGSTLVKRPISPPTLVMDRNNSMRHQADDCSKMKPNAGEGISASADGPILRSDGTTATGIEACSTREATAGAVTGGATAAAAAGLTAVAEAVTAATKSIALAAVTAAGPAGTRKGSNDGGKTPRASVAHMPAAGALAAAAGAAAAVAAAPRVAEDASLNAAGGASAPAAVGAEIGDKLLPKKRQKLVLVQDPVKLQAIRLLAVLGEWRENALSGPENTLHTHWLLIGVLLIQPLTNALHTKAASPGHAHLWQENVQYCTYAVHVPHIPQARMSRCALHLVSHPSVAVACECWPWTGVA